MKAIPVLLRLVVAALAGALLLAGAASASTSAPIVTVVREGGLCLAGSACRSTLRIDDSTISGEGYVPRRLTPGERRVLLRAIAMLDLRSIKAHPFTGTCPIAYDGSESTYRFRGFARVLSACKYNLGDVEAVRVAERLLATLKPARR